jgi:hypothetical protein
LGLPVQEVQLGSSTSYTTLSRAWWQQRDENGGRAEKEVALGGEGVIIDFV